MLCQIMPLEMSKIALQLDSVNAYKNNMFNAMAAVYKERGLQGFNVGYLGGDLHTHIAAFVCVYIVLFLFYVLGVQYRQAAWSAGYFASLPFFEAKVPRHSVDCTHHPPFIRIVRV